VRTDITADIEALLVDPARGWPEESGEWRPVAFVDLDACAASDVVPPLPPYPVIGLGDSAHPWAAQLDALIEPPVSAEAVLRQIQRAPHAAAVTMHVLRHTAGLRLEDALTFESVSYGLLQGSAEFAEWLAARKPSGPLPVGAVHVERRGADLYLTLDRPVARNAIDRAMRDQLFDAFTVASLDSEVQRIHLTAVGTSFSMGGDLVEFGTTRDLATAHLIRSRTLPARALLGCADRLEVHVQGACVGAGLEIAAFADRVTATADAWFQLPETAMGLLPGAGGCVSVPRRIGRQRAGLMMLSGRRINAMTALLWGLIDAIEDQPTIDEGRADDSSR
jgi:enoyl-CoA hydratase